MRIRKAVIEAAVAAAISFACAVTDPTDHDAVESSDTGQPPTWCCTCVRVDDHCRSSCELAVHECEDAVPAAPCLGSAFEAPDIDGLPDCGHQTAVVDADFVGCPLTCSENVP